MPFKAHGDVYHARRAINLHQKSIKAAVIFNSLIICTSLALIGIGIGLNLPWIGPGLGATPTRFMRYYSLNLWISLLVAVPLIGVAIYCLWNRVRIYSYDYDVKRKCVIAFNYSIALILMGFGIAMVVCTDAGSDPYKPSWRAYVSLDVDHRAKHIGHAQDDLEKYHNVSESIFNDQRLSNFQFLVNLAWFEAFGKVNEKDVVDTIREGHLTFKNTTNFGVNEEMQDDDLKQTLTNHLLFGQSISSLSDKLFQEDLRELFLVKNPEYCVDDGVAEAFSKQYGVDRCPRPVDSNLSDRQQCDDCASLCALYVLLTMFRLQWVSGIVFIFLSILIMIFTIPFFLRALSPSAYWAEPPEAEDYVEAEHQGLLDVKNQAKEHQEKLDDLKKKGIRTYGEVDVVQMGPQQNPFYPMPNPYGEHSGKDDNPFVQKTDVREKKVLAVDNTDHLIAEYLQTKHSHEGIAHRQVSGTSKDGSSGSPSRRRDDWSSQASSPSTNRHHGEGSPQGKAHQRPFGFTPRVAAAKVKEARKIDFH